MESLVAIIIQIGLMFVPVIVFLILKNPVLPRAIHVFLAVALALLTGWSAAYFISEHAWRPRLKHGGSVDFSASEGFWLHFAGTLILLLCLAFYQSVGERAAPGGRSGERAAKARGWRVGHLGRDRVYYEELHDEVWQRLEIDGEMLTGPAHHVLYFASPEKWETFPEWARGRREEIIGRIKSEFGAPDYEHHGA